MFTEKVQHEKNKQQQKKKTAKFIPDALNVCSFSLTHMAVQPEAEQALLCPSVIY